MFRLVFFFFFFFTENLFIYLLKVDKKNTNITLKSLVLTNYTKEKKKLLQTHYLALYGGN